MGIRMIHGRGCRVLGVGRWGLAGIVVGVAWVGVAGSGMVEKRWGWQSRGRDGMGLERECGDGGVGVCEWWRSSCPLRYRQQKTIRRVRRHYQRN